MNEKYYGMIIAMTRQQSRAKLFGKPCHVCMGNVTLRKLLRQVLNLILYIGKSGTLESGTSETWHFMAF